MITKGGGRCYTYSSAMMTVKTRWCGSSIAGRTTAECCGAAHPATKTEPSVQATQRIAATSRTADPSLALPPERVDSGVHGCRPMHGTSKHSTNSSTPLLQLEYDRYILFDY